MVGPLTGRSLGNPQPGDCRACAFSLLVLKRDISAPDLLAASPIRMRKRHDIIRSKTSRVPRMLWRSYRWCWPRAIAPQSEDKVVKVLPIKTSHQVFLEPEGGLDDHTIYPKVFLTPLPEDVAGLSTYVLLLD